MLFVGTVLAKLERVDDALMMLNRAIVLQPNNIEPYAKLAFMYADRDTNKANEYFEKCVQMDRNHPASRKHLEEEQQSMGISSFAPMYSPMKQQILSFDDDF